MSKKDNAWKLDGLISQERAERIRSNDTTSQTRLEAISGMFSEEAITPPSEAEKRVRKRITDSEEYIDKAVAEAIERESKKKKNDTVKECEKKRSAFIVNDEESLKLFKQYCYLHDLRIQDVFEVLIKSFLADPDSFSVKSNKS